jgi:stress-induced morphogen
VNRHDRIDQRLRDALAPHTLTVVDESHLHASGPGAETHFQVVVTSERFRGLTRVARHRLVNELLRDELAQGLHALSIQAHAPGEPGAGVVAPPPPCLGGSKADARGAELRPGPDARGPSWT